MPERNPQDEKLRKKRIRDDMKVLTYLMDKDTLKNSATGIGESPPKLVIFYAGYIAMRSLWEIKTEDGKKKNATGDQKLDMNKSNPDSLIYRIDKEIAHPLGYPTSTLLRVANFKYWGRKILRTCGQ